MASAAFEAVRAMGSASATERRRRGLTGTAGAPCARRRRGAWPPPKARPGALLHGLGASALIASGYVAFVSGLRWLFGA
jgi:hypothetical protein